MSLICSIVSNQSDVHKMNKIKNNEDPCMNTTINAVKVCNSLTTNTNFSFCLNLHLTAVLTFQHEIYSTFNNTFPTG